MDLSNSQEASIAEKPVLEPVTEYKYNFEGPLGDMLNNVTKHWLLTAPKANPAMLEIFTDRDVVPFRDKMPWAGEFAGKYLTAAVEVYRANRDPELKSWLAEFVSLLISRQAEDGYLGPWPKTMRLTNTNGVWDTWGHYHIMVGLLLWYEETGDRQALDCARSIADLMCEKYLGDKSPRLVETGSTEMNLAPAHSLGMLYRITGNKQYLDLAKQIVHQFAAKADDNFLAGDYLNASLEGKEFFQLPKPRWESLHPIMSLAELYWITGERKYREAYENLWWSIVEYDRHNNGGFSSGEKATGNPYDPNPIETCCTIAWMAASVEMLKLSGESVVADELEFSTLNSIFGMHSGTGRWATYNTPSDGARFASAHHIVFQARPGSPELNCCSVNSTRGFGMISDWAVMRGSEGIFVNHYGPSIFDLPLEGKFFKITQKTDYPLSGKITMDVETSCTEPLTLHLRIPHWSKATQVKLNGKPVEAIIPGSYLPIKREWQDNDLIEIDLDMSLHFWSGERDRKGLVSIYRGPILLAYDQRYNRSRHAGSVGESHGGDPGYPLWDALTPPDFDRDNLNLQPVHWEDWLPPQMLFKVIADDATEAFLCDFASAGQTGSLYRSWLPCSGVERKEDFSKTNPLRSFR